MRNKLKETAMVLFTQIDHIISYFLDSMIFTIVNSKNGDWVQNILSGTNKPSCRLVQFRIRDWYDKMKICTVLKNEDRNLFTNNMYGYCLYHLLTIDSLVSWEIIWVVRGMDAAAVVVLVCTFDVVAFLRFPSNLSPEVIMEVKRLSSIAVLEKIKAH